ncbi:MAG: DUF4169 family protein [Rhodobacteraceae bacterium]|nr:DUF4169 family protein [Paracoccaceae bacterium]
MAEIVNLRTARKAQARAKARAEADANALRFGRTKMQRNLEEAQVDKARANLDAHKREEPEA